MFQNSFQGGSHFEIFDPKEAMNKANKEKEKFYEKLMKINSPQHVQKQFDKTLKCYIFEIEGHNTKLQFPKDDKGELCLVQQYLVLQLFIPQGLQWGIELVLTDTSKTKRRVILSSNSKTLEKKFFHLRAPCDAIQKGVWLNLCFDVWSFMEAWKGQTFRSLDMIILNSTCKLRKIFVTKTPIEDSEEMDSQQVPKNVNFPPTISYANKLIGYKHITQEIPENIDVKGSQSISGSQEEAVQKQIKNRNISKSYNQKKTFATQFSISQQKNVKRKTYEKSTRGSSVEKQDSDKDETPMKSKRIQQQQQIKNGKTDPMTKKQSENLQQNDFQEVEENIEGEEYEDFENEFEDIDQGNQFREKSQNEDFDIVGQKIQIPKEIKFQQQKQQQQQQQQLLAKNKKLLPIKQLQNKQIQSNQENSASSTGLMIQHQQQIPTQTSGSQTGEIRKKNQEILRSPLNLQNQENKEQAKLKNQNNNPWSINKKDVKEQQSSSRNQKEQQIQKPSSKSPIRSVQSKQKGQNQSEQSESQEVKAVKYQPENMKQKKQNQIPNQKQKVQNQVAYQVEEQKDQDQDEIGNHTQEDYYQLSQKFSTITDPRLFKFDEDKKKSIDSKLSQSKKKYDEEIEENIEVDTLSIKNKNVEYEQNDYYHSNRIEDSQNKQQFTDKNFNKRSISELKPIANDSINSYNKEENLEDSLEGPTTSYGQKTFQGYNPEQSQWKKNKYQEQKREDSETTFAEGFYANQLKKYTEIQARPFTPPFESVVQLNGIHSNSDEKQDENMVDLLYDPLMNCYYDPNTNQYYELKD